MSIIKQRHDSLYAQIPNATLQDFTISNAARSVLFYLLSLPDHWQVSRKNVAKVVGVSLTTLQKYLSELREAGYVVYRQNKTDKNRFTSGDYLVFCFPQPLPSKGSSRTPKKLVTGKHGDIERKSIRKKK